MASSIATAVSYSSLPMPGCSLATFSDVAVPMAELATTCLSALDTRPC